MISIWQLLHSKVFPMYIIVLLLFVFAANTDAARKADPKIVVAYPEVREPYNQIFNSLRKGIQAESEFENIAYALEKDTTVEEFLEWFNKKQVVGLIALGNRGSTLVNHIVDKVDVPIVIGGTFIDASVENSLLPGISMAPDPELLFRHQLKLFPKTQKIHVIYEGDQLWLVERAKIAARKLGIHLNALPAKNIRELATAYQKILSTQESETEALWLPYSGKSLEKALLNDVLEKAWQRDLTVFSSNLADVSKGILFSMYPDNELTGKRLARLLRECLQKEKRKGEVVLLSRDLNIALNTRTSDHLEIRMTTEDKNAYEILFPLKR